MNLPACSIISLLPRPRCAANHDYRPHDRVSLPQWHWIDCSNTSPIISHGDPLLDENIYLNRHTPTGLTETELLASFNYLESDALISFDGIGPTLAANIIAHRAKSQYFSSLDELALVPKIGAKRFAKLAGRPHQILRFRLHDLMRRSRHENIYLADLQPWHNPAAGIANIHVHPANENIPTINLDQELLVVRLRRYRIHFYCTEPLSGGRAKFIYHNLPEVLRPLLS